MMKQINFDSAINFLSYLRLSKDHWLNENQWQSDWIFRGQSCSEWDLTPTLCREKNRHIIIEKASEFEMAECSRRSEIHFVGSKEVHINERQNFEYGTLIELIETRLIKDFINYSDGAGLDLPRLEEFRSQTIRNGHAIDWHPTHHPPHPILGFAQHHGVPTRLLDWTKNPLIASFFAIESLKPEDNEGMFTIWAIRSDVLRNHKIFTDIGANDGSRFELMEVKKSENKFLFSQEGLFTFNRCITNWYRQKGEFPKIEDLLNKIEKHTGDSIFRKLNLIKTQRTELMRLLHVEGITHIRLMPFYDNVVKTMQQFYLSI